MAKLIYDVHAYDSRNFSRTNMYVIRISKLEGLELYVSSFSGLLGYQVNVLNLNWNNEPVKMAERPELNEMSLVVHDNIEKEAAKKIYYWFIDVYDPKTRRVGLPSKYKTVGELEQLDTKGIPVNTWRLEGLWPSSVEIAEFSYENAEVVEITATLQVDRVYLL